MDGLDVVRELSQRSPFTECILLTGYASQESAIKAITLGTFAFFQKPYQTEQLLLAVQQAVEKHNIILDLTQNEARFRTISENSLAGLSIVQDGKLQYVNSALAEIIGYHPSELIGKSL